MTLASSNNGWRLAAGLSLLLGACTFDGKDLDSYPCNAAHPQCPAGYTCNGTRCVKPGESDNGVPDGPVTKSDTTSDGLPPDSPRPDAPLDGPPQPDGPKPDGPLADGPLPPDGPTTDGPLQPDAPLPDGPLPPDAWVQLDVPQPDLYIPDLPPPDLVPPADGACSPSGATQSCYTGPASTKGVGICTTGTQTCTGGSWGACAGEVTPAASDPCDGLDNDCDGTSDDGYACVQGSGSGCTTSCGSWGWKVCSAACTWGTCAPPAETCNGLDDDCDGAKDNGFVCVQNSTTTCTTTCGSTGSKKCSATCIWPLTCTPPAETCNGVDDDCDGTKDDGFECVQGTTGTCTNSCGFTGTRTCGSTCKWGSCIVPEVCDGKDNDCDLKVDEDFDCVQFTTGTCTTSCGSTGTRECGTMCVWKTCNPPAEVCNLLDDDCDSVVDNGLPKNTYYKDADGDGQGTSLSTTLACMLPPGYASNKDDCYDGNKDAKKGQTAWFTKHRGDGSFDYNCVNGTEYRYVKAICYATIPSGCTPNGAEMYKDPGTTPACGDPIQTAICNAACQVQGTGLYTYQQCH